MFGSPTFTLYLRRIHPAGPATFLPSQLLQCTIKDTVELEFDSTVITMKPTFNVAHLWWESPKRHCQIVTGDTVLQVFSAQKNWMLGKQLSFCFGFRFGEGHHGWKDLASSCVMFFFVNRFWIWDLYHPKECLKHTMFIHTAIQVQKVKVYKDSGYGTFRIGGVILTKWPKTNQ